MTLIQTEAQTEPSTDESTLAGLIKAAILNSAMKMQDVDVRGDPQTIYRPNADGWRSELLSAPNYRAEHVWDRFDEVWHTGSSQALLEYIWPRTKLSISVKRDGDRASWERCAWGELVHATLLYLLARAAGESLATTGSYRPWQVNESEAEQAAADLADQLCNKRRTAVGLCPALGLWAIEGEYTVLRPGLRVRGWTAAERVVFLTRYQHEYLDDDWSPVFGRTVVEIGTRTDDLTPEGASLSIAQGLDELKWAIMVSTPSDTTFEEGPVIVRSPSGWHGQTLRRGDTLRRTRSLPAVRIAAQTAECIRDVLADLNAARPASGRIDAALWQFGRSCNAPLARDALLDAVVGLEMLLVSGPGDSTYRFALHGLALLSQGSDDTVDEKLKRIYGLRSRAAHGSSSDTRDFQKMAPVARRLLARAIYAVVRGVKDGSLDVAAAKGDVATAVTRHVRQRLAEPRDGTRRGVAKK